MANLARLFRDQYGRFLAVPDGLPERMAIVQARYGSNRAAARAVGVDERTWRRWLSGTTRPRPGSLDMLGQAARQVRSDAIRFQFRSMSATQREGPRGERSRTFDARGLRWDPSADRRVENALRRGDWSGAAQAFRGGIRDHGYADLFDEWFEYDYADEEIDDSGYSITPGGISA